jgi:rubrerythrin
MAHRNPWKARLAQHKKRWPVALHELQAQAYAVLQMAYEGVADEDAEQRRKNILAYFQGLTAFNRLQESVELEARLTALEHHLEARNGHFQRLRTLERAFHCERCGTPLTCPTCDHDDLPRLDPFTAALERIWQREEGADDEHP